MEKGRPFLDRIYLASSHDAIKVWAVIRHGHPRQGFE